MTTESTQLTGEKISQNHRSDNIMPSTTVGEFTCESCGELFERKDAAKPSSKTPRTCAKCYSASRAEGRAKRKAEEVKSKKVGKSARTTFTMDQYTLIAIDTLAVGGDRSKIVEEAILRMLADDPAAKAYVERRVAAL